MLSTTPYTRWQKTKPVMEHEGKTIYNAGREEGLVEGRVEGRNEGLDEARLESIKNVMRGLKYSA